MDFFADDVTVEQKKLGTIRYYAICIDRGLEIFIRGDREDTPYPHLFGKTDAEILDSLHESINAMHALILQIKRLRKEGE